MIFKVSGYNVNFWSGDEHAVYIRQLLNNSGIGINSVVNIAHNFFTGYQEFLIDVITPQNEDANRVKFLLFQILAPTLGSTIGVDYISGVPSVPTSGGGINDNLDEYLKKFATGAGISTPILIGAGLLFLLLYLKK